MQLHVLYAVRENCLKVTRQFAIKQPNIRHDCIIYQRQLTTDISLSPILSAYIHYTLRFEQLLFIILK